MQNNSNREHLIPMIKNIIENYFLKLSSQVNSEKKKNIIIGLGSGSTVAELIKRISIIKPIEPNPKLTKRILNLFPPQSR